MDGLHGWFCSILSSQPLALLSSSDLAPCSASASHSQGHALNSSISVLASVCVSFHSDHNTPNTMNPTIIQVAGTYNSLARSSFPCSPCLSYHHFSFSQFAFSTDNHLCHYHSGLSHSCLLSVVIDFMAVPKLSPLQSILHSESRIIFETCRSNQSPPVALCHSRVKSKICSMVYKAPLSLAPITSLTPCHATLTSLSTF